MCTATMSNAIHLVKDTYAKQFLEINGDFPLDEAAVAGLKSSPRIVQNHSIHSQKV